MDSNQLNEFATNALLNHWPPHLGVRTEAEKMEYLAQRLTEAADAEERADGLADELETAQEEVPLLRDENADLADQIKTLKSDIKSLEAKIAQAREVLV
jgi:peptidoglycan hydrolase CwlO-like protein